jgi:hypothetical protein
VESALLLGLRHQFLEKGRLKKVSEMLLIPENIRSHDDVEILSPFGKTPGAIRVLQMRALSKLKHNLDRENT